jgi:hypothetical protein
MLFVLRQIQPLHSKGTYGLVSSQISFQYGMARQAAAAAEAATFLHFLKRTMTW